MALTEQIHLATLRCTNDGVSTLFKLVSDPSMKKKLQRLSTRPLSEDGLYIAKAIDGDHLASILIAEIDRLIADSPTTNFKRGYLAGLVFLYRKALDHVRLQADARIDAAEQLIAEAFAPTSGRRQ